MHMSAPSSNSLYKMLPNLATKISYHKWSKLSPKLLNWYSHVALVRIENLLKLGFVHVLFVCLSKIRWILKTKELGNICSSQCKSGWFFLFLNDECKHKINKNKNFLSKSHLQDNFTFSFNPHLQDKKLTHPRRANTNKHF